MEAETGGIVLEQRASHRRPLQIGRGRDSLLASGNSLPARGKFPAPAGQGRETPRIPGVFRMRRAKKSEKFPV